MTAQQLLEQAIRFHQSGDLASAERFYRQVLTIHPNDPKVGFHLANALKGQSRTKEAIECYRRAISLKPDFVEAWNNLGNALKQLGRLEEAAGAYQRAIALRPGDAEAYFNLANVFSSIERMDEAIAAYRQAVAVRPDAGYVWANLGNALRESGELDEAIACYRKAVELESNPIAAGNLLYTLYLHPDFTPQQILQEHLNWNERFAKPLALSIPPHTNDPSPDRKLRLGYVSHDLSSHPVGRFMLPLLSHHNRDEFEIVCYSDGPVDAMTERLRRHVDAWRDTTGISDEQLAQWVRQEGIDILIDLAMHTAGGRLNAFARKPAPVEVTYLAYCGTTGLQTMDYRLTDPYLDPPDSNQQQFYVEQSIRLPHSYWCYQPLERMPDVSPLPVSITGNVTFGCFSNFSKVSRPALAIWAQILREVPNSKLLLQAAQGPHRQRMKEMMSDEGVDPDRIEFLDRVALPKYFERFSRIDIALDPFPCGGATTTCDALWMGVPVVSLAGQTAMARSGLSILANAGLPELVASDRQEYIAIARKLADDRAHLTKLRSSLRERLVNSPLMNAAAFTSGVENAFRQLWRSWCSKQT